MSVKPLDVLLVEDHEPDAFTVTRFVEQLNHAELLRSGSQALRVERASRLSQALDLLKKKDFDAILLDLTLPDSVSLHTGRSILSAAPEPALVILTSAEDEDLAERAILEGAQDFLTKPRLTPPLLLRTLRYACQRQRALNALRSATLLDALTGLYSRRGLLFIGDMLLDLSSRTGAGASLLLIELPRSSEFGHTQGHEALDMLLLDVAELLKQSFDNGDLLARIDDSSFCALALRQGEFGDRLRANGARYNREHPHQDPVEFRIGLAQCLPPETTTVEDLLLQARFHIQARASASATIP